MLIERDNPIVKIYQQCDGFSIEIGDRYWNFNQEDTVENLVAVFKTLGYIATFEESF